MLEAAHADGAAMEDFQAGPLHAAVQLDPKRGLAAQELLVLDIVLEVQQTLKLQIREATHADGQAGADGEDALHHAAAEAKAVQGHAAQEVLVLHIVLEVQVEAKDVLLEAQHADGEAGADGQAALYHAAAELRQGQGDAMLVESAQEVQANQGRDAILNRAGLHRHQRCIGATA